MAPSYSSDRRRIVAAACTCLKLTTALTMATAFCALAQTVDVVVNPGVEHQTIEGFGSMIKQDVCCDQQDLADDSYLQMIHDDLGVRVIRIWTPMMMEPTNDNGDPNSLDWSKLDFAGSGGDRATWYFWAINRLKQFGDMKFIASVLSPPSWMKDNNSLVNGGHLLPSMRAELAENLVAFYRAVQESCGVNLYGISLQNEPAFEEWYGSCVYTAEEYRDALKVLGARFAQEGIQTKLHGADDMLSRITVTPYAGFINADPEARQYLDAFSVHGYTDGVNPQPNSGAAQAWGRLGTIGAGMGVATWMTECAGWESSDAISPALHMGMALKHGNISLWVYLALNSCDQYGLLCNKQHTPRSAAAKNYYHFILPGAVRIDADYTDPHLLVTAFHHKGNRTLTIVAVNDTAGTRQMNLQGAGLPATMRRYATTASGTQKLCADEGDVATTGPVPVEGYHVVTLFAQNYDPPSSVRASRRIGAHGLHGSTLAAGTRVRLYRPNGAVAATLTCERPNSWPATLAPGTYCARADNGHATVVVVPGRHSVAK